MAYFDDLTSKKVGRNQYGRFCTSRRRSARFYVIYGQLPCGLLLLQPQVYDNYVPCLGWYRLYVNRNALVTHLLNFLVISKKKKSMQTVQSAFVKIL